PQLPNEYLGPDPYDINFSLPIDERHLETERVKLTPFNPAIHAKEYWDSSSRHPSYTASYPSTSHPLTNSCECWSCT
ncbi:hypothetical protein BC834DRAFT_892665, partial [Gloeopeniophorella convolvens]